MNIDIDKQFQEVKVVSAREEPTGWSVERDDGWHLYVTNETCKVAPQPGETMRCYGKGIGYDVRGIVINGRVYRYRTQAEAERDHKDQVARHDAKRREDYEAKRTDFDARVMALVEPLRLRIERFRALGGDDWRYQYEPYELFACEQAAVIAEAVPLAELEAFRSLPYEDQRLRVAKLDDGHSGNTFGAACHLARLLLERPDLAVKAHGAMCPLVGCEDYGCWAGREGRAEATAGRA